MGVGPGSRVCMRSTRPSREDESPLSVDGGGDVSVAAAAAAAAAGAGWCEGDVTGGLSSGDVRASQNSSCRHTHAATDTRFASTGIDIEVLRHGIGINPSKYQSID